MMAMIGIAYTSRVARSLGSSDLDDLLLGARTSNSLVQLTGVLVYGDGVFFQFFEGGDVDVVETYERIKRSSLHTDIVELERREIAERLFRKWFMGFREAPSSRIQKLSDEHWQREAPWAADHAKHSPGIRQLLQFFNEAMD
jgi:hypothetical protein